MQRKGQNETISTRRDLRDRLIKSSLFPLRKGRLREGTGDGQGTQVAGLALR